MKLNFFIIAVLSVTITTPAFALTDSQSKAMYRHGIWNWSIETCPGIYRGRRYWYYLKEAGEFSNVTEISKNEGGKIYSEGREYMQENADKFGVQETCEYAKKQWPALLWSEKKEEEKLVIGVENPLSKVKKVAPKTNK
ncbi:MAG: hypothetical protein COC00_010735 [Rhizobiales bacterium]|nr:hypothetical protein [Hyphomicrobiales bacterium]